MAKKLKNVLKDRSEKVILDHNEKIKQNVMEHVETVSKKFTKASAAANDFNSSLTKVKTSIPESHINKYIYVYTGGMPQITIEGITFGKSVPTYLPMRFHGKLSEEFQHIDNVNITGTPTNPIFVRCPNNIENMVACVSVLYRLRSFYPTCQIQALCLPQYKDLLPEHIDYIAEKNSKIRYYREVNLQESKVAQYWLTPYNLTIQPRHLLLMQAAQVFLPEDKKYPAPKCDRAINKSNEIEFCIEYNDFGRKLIEKYSNVTFISPDDNTFHLDSPRGVVFNYDSPLIYYYLYMDIPVLVFMDKNRYKHQNQMKAYPNVNVYLTPGANKHEEAFEIIKKFMTETKDRNGYNREHI